MCVDGGGEKSLKILYLIQKKREAQGKGAMSFAVSQSEPNSLEEIVLVVKTG